MPSINLNGELFHYGSVGEGLPFVFQHGMGADLAQPLSSGADLAGWRMIAMDCRGHGQTEAKLDPARISFVQFAEDLKVLLDSLNIERAVVGGISMGAGVALAFALASPGTRERANPGAPRMARSSLSDQSSLVSARGELAPRLPRRRGRPTFRAVARILRT